MKDNTEPTLITMLLFLALLVLPQTNAENGPPVQGTQNDVPSHLEELLQATNNNVSLSILTSNLALLYCNVYCDGTSKKHIVNVPENCSLYPYCRKCHCDNLCEEYDDCCPDKYGQVKSKQNTNYECVGETGSKHDINGYFMVTSCPGGSNINWTDNDVINPVTSLQTKVTYVNPEIAKCNMVTSLVLHWGKPQDCSLNKTQQAGCVPLIKPTVDITTRLCTPLSLDRRVIDSCTISRIRVNSRLEIDVESKCIEGPVNIVSDSDKVFKNIYCFLCNGFDILSCITFARKDTANSINDLVELNSKPNCDSGTWYDKLKNICRELHCPIGHELKEQDCVSTKVNLTDVEFSFRRNFWSHDSNQQTPGTRMALESLIVKNLPGIMAEIDVYDFFFSIDYKAIVFLHDGFRLTVSDSTPDFGLNLHFRTKRACCRQDYQELVSNHLSSNWTLIGNGSSYKYQTRKDEPRFISQEISSFKVVSPSVVPVEVDTDTSLAQILGRPELYINLPVIEPTCAFVYLSHKEFRLNNDESITLKYADITVPLDNVTKTSEETLIVCRSVLEELYKQYNDILQNAKNIISQICSVLSLICLTLTFITYCTFPSLLTLPTKNTMCLVVSLFIAQALYHFKALAVSGSTECKVIGVIIHYTWLCVIFWMNVCSFHMFNVFVLETTKPITLHGSNKRLFHYLLYANGTPAVIVLATITANLVVSSGSQIGYGDGRCYLSSALLTGVSFVLPLGMVLILNSIFFGMSVWTMAKISKMSDAVGKDRNQVHIYVKLSTLTGVFWIFSLLGQSLNLDVLIFISIILNASQGVFIFISYVANKRILKMWRGKFGQEEPGMTSSISIISSKPGREKEHHQP